MGLITLTTDFGPQDHYPACMKGVMLSIASEARLVDITHDITPYDITHGAFILRQIIPCFPAGTIHVVVVDPGVGSTRRILLGRFAGQYVIAPDNGLFTFLHREVKADLMHVVDNRRYFLTNPSNTFHGRDIMAPVAAHLHNGVRPQEFGRPAGHIEVLPGLTAIAKPGVITGDVMHIDRFGNLITSINKAAVVGAALRDRIIHAYVNGEDAGPIRATFSDVAVGQLVAYVGSAGLLEVAVNQGSAAERFGPRHGIVVELR